MLLHVCQHLMADGSGILELAMAVISRFLQGEPRRADEMTGKTKTQKK
jgi:hypothetical protein